MQYGRHCKKIHNVSPVAHGLTAASVNVLSVAKQIIKALGKGI